MNFNIKESSVKRKNNNNNNNNNNKSKTKTIFGFGLNSRKKTKKETTRPTTTGTKKHGLNSFFTPEEEEEEEKNESSKIVVAAAAAAASASSRSYVNRELAAEQEALRKRAEKAMNDSTIYDYDGEYESFSSQTKQQQQKQKQKEQDDNNNNNNKYQEKRESRYIGNLLTKAKERKQEREIIMERKIAKEQKVDDNKEEFLDKDKFVTRAYKRVLKERESWLEKDKVQSQIDDELDVTKMKGGGVMGFYSNFTHNVAVGGDNGSISGGGGGGSSSVKDPPNTNSDVKEQRNVRPTKADNQKDSIVNDDLPNNRNSNNLKRGDSQIKNTSNTNSKIEYEEIVEEEIDNELQQQTIRAKRIQKLFDARDRYFQRIGNHYYNYNNNNIPQKSV